jgi:hypothetical protein
VPFPSFIINREAFLKIGGLSTRFKIAGDFDLIVRTKLSFEPMRFDLPIAKFFAGGVSYTQAPLAWREEYLIRSANLNLSFWNSLQDQIFVKLRVTKWYLGKSLDSLQRLGVLGKSNWRERRSSQVPEEFKAFLNSTK